MNNTSFWKRHWEWEIIINELDKIHKELENTNNNFNCMVRPRVKEQESKY